MRLLAVVTYAFYSLAFYSRPRKRPAYLLVLQRQYVFVIAYLVLVGVMVILISSGIAPWYTMAGALTVMVSAFVHDGRTFFDISSKEDTIIARDFQCLDTALAAKAPDGMQQLAAVYTILQAPCQEALDRLKQHIAVLEACESLELFVAPDIAAAQAEAAAHLAQRGRSAVVQDRTTETPLPDNALAAPVGQLAIEVKDDQAVAVSEN